MDPVNTFTVPKYQTAAGTADIMSHIFELYFDGTPGKYMQDRVMEGLLKTCIHFGIRLLARSRMIMEGKSQFDVDVKLGD